jgi:hypothetical protein
MASTRIACRRAMFALFAVQLIGFACANPNEDLEPIAPEQISVESVAIRPRGITLTMPLEHTLASGGIQTFVDRPAKRGIIFAGPGQPPLPIFLNRFGGTYSPGQDDSRANTSIVPNQRSTVTAYNGGDGEWSQVVSCLTDMFAPYNVVIVENEPAGGEYIEAVIGGSPQQVGLPSGVGGVAPIDEFRCNIIPNAIVFAFSNVVGSDPQASCEIAAQEIAHAISLDHEYHCPDPMTYLGGCGNKTFRDFDAQCGEYQPRACNCGRTRQNSVQVLTDKLGTNSGMPPPPPPNDPNPPTVQIDAPANGATLPPDSTITVQATATDDLQIAATELVWEFTNSTFPCPYSGGGGSVTCTRSGNVSTWQLRVGQGDRTFLVRARDTANNVTETQRFTIHLGTMNPMPMDTTPPVASIQSPADGATLQSNSTIRVLASASDDVGLASVELVWAFGGDAFPCPFNGQGVSCTQMGGTYTWSLNVGVGTRQFSVRAIDLAGNRFETPTRTVTLGETMMPDPGADGVAEENDAPGQAFPGRCGNAIDLVVSAADEDWFAFDAPANTAVEVGIAANAGTVIGVELYSSDAATKLAETTDILANGGSLRGLSQGPTLLARITTPNTTGVGYRLTALCEMVTPPPGPNDDRLEDNDLPGTAAPSTCNSSEMGLMASDADYFRIDVPADNDVRVTVNGAGVEVTIVDGNGQAMTQPGSEAMLPNAPAGPLVVKVEPTGQPASYDVHFECSPTGQLPMDPPGDQNPDDDPAMLPTKQGPLSGSCGCSTPGLAVGNASVATLALMLLALVMRKR